MCTLERIRLAQRVVATTPPVWTTPEKGDTVNPGLYSEVEEVA